MYARVKPRPAPARKRASARPATVKVPPAS
jgi:hypothetical protein